MDKGMKFIIEFTRKRNNAKELYEKQDYENALESYKELLEEYDPSNIDFMCKIAECAFMLEKFGEALKYINQAVERDKNYAKAWRIKSDILEMLAKLEDKPEFERASKKCFKRAEKLDERKDVKK